MKNGDIVVFVGNDDIKYEVITDEYVFLGKKVVDLERYIGEVGVEYLKVVTE
jgi:hypothetical protein